VPALRPRERRLVVLAGLLVMGVVGYVYVVEPLLEAHAATRELVVGAGCSPARSASWPGPTPTAGSWKR
jgi:hypothetical protein